MIIVLLFVALILGFILTRYIDDEWRNFTRGVMFFIVVITVGACIGISTSSFERKAKILASVQNVNSMRVTAIEVNRVAQVSVPEPATALVGSNGLANLKQSTNASEVIVDYRNVWNDANSEISRYRMDMVNPWSSWLMTPLSADVKLPPFELK
jgi:L-cystine uptake protein TcyP (sodium:dicarboxylate symporter family)